MDRREERIHPCGLESRSESTNQIDNPHVWVIRLPRPRHKPSDVRHPLASIRHIRPARADQSQAGSRRRPAGESTSRPTRVGQDSTSKWESTPPKSTNHKTESVNFTHESETPSQPRPEQPIRAEQPHAWVIRLPQLLYSSSDGRQPSVLTHRI